MYSVIIESLDLFTVIIPLFLLAEIGMRVMLYISRRASGRFKTEYLLFCPVSWTNRYSKTNYYRSHPFISYVKRENCDSPRYPSNNLGYAGRKAVDRNRSNAYRIYVCGDSTVEQNDYDMVPPFDPEVTWPHVMGKELERMTGQSIEVVNAAVSAYTSIESLADFQLRGLSLKPNMAIFHQNLTDAWLSQSVAGFKPDYTHNRRTVSFATKFRPPDFRVSYLYQFLKMRFLSSKDALISYLVKSNRFESDLSLTPEHFSTYRNNLRSFCSICETNDIIPVVSLYRYSKAKVSSPPGHDFDPEALNKFLALLEKNNEIIREVSEEFSTALLLDPAPLEDSHYRTNDWMHWSKSGIELMGRRAAECLASTVEISKRDGSS